MGQRSKTSRYVNVEVDFAMRLIQSNIYNNGITMIKRQLPSA
jgi:hypothetical protein